MTISEILSELGAKTSKSEERGLSMIDRSSLLVFSPGISTGGFAEIRMAQANPQRKIIATTIDQNGLEFANEIIKQTDFESQIETKFEDLRSEWLYPENYFDFIYARLVLHYLSAQDLDRVIANFTKSLKLNGRVFSVVRSVENIDRNDPEVSYDPETKFTTEAYRNRDGEITGRGIRYFHTLETISDHFKKAGLEIECSIGYKEQLYKDFMRKEVAQKMDHVIETTAIKTHIK